MMLLPFSCKQARHLAQAQNSHSFSFTFCQKAGQQAHASPPRVGRLCEQAQAGPRRGPRAGELGGGDLGGAPACGRGSPGLLAPGWPRACAASGRRTRARLHEIDRRRRGQPRGAWSGEWAGRDQTAGAWSSGDGAGLLLSRSFSDLAPVFRSGRLSFRPCTGVGRLWQGRGLSRAGAGAGAGAARRQGSRRPVELQPLGTRHCGRTGWAQRGGLARSCRAPAGAGWSCPGVRGGLAIA